MKRTISDFLPTVLQEIERTYMGKGWPNGFLTGFSDFDFMTGGIRRDLTVIGAAPGGGLSSLARQIGMRMARDGHRGAIFDFEQTPEMVAQRLLAMESGLADMKLRTGLLKLDELGKLMIAAGRIEEVPLLLEERKLYTVSELCERIRVLSRRESCEWAIIDRLDHVLPDTGDISPERELAEKVRALRSLQEELKISIIVLCHVFGDTKNRFPGVAFRHEAGPIMREANTVLFLRRSDRTETDLPDTATGPLFFPEEISILKQCAGPVGSVLLEFSPLLGVFRECPVSTDEPETKSDHSDNEEKRQ